MRDVPAAMTATWRSGEFIGDRRPIARVMIQKANIRLYRSGKNTFATLPFGMTDAPKELPNVKSVSWDRDIDSDVATCAVELYNTAQLPIGVAPTSEDFDLPGFYTANRGKSSLSSRWGHTPNEWADMLIPDNVIHTYEGYGFDPDVCPDEDPNLVLTGMWIIDSVQMTAAGTISLSCRDFGRLLLDHIAMEPVIPKAFYPLKFKTMKKKSGIKPPQIIEVSGDSQGGPNDPPANVTVVPGNASALVSWDAMPEVAPEITPLPDEYQGGTAYKTASNKYYLRMPEGKWYICTGPGQVAGVEYLYGPWIEISDDVVGNVIGTVVDFFGGPGGIEQYTPRFEAVGFRLYLNENLQGYALDENDLSVTLNRLLNGSVYMVQVAAIYQELNTGRRYTTTRSAPLFFSPRTDTAVAVDMFSVETGYTADGSVVEGAVRWAYVGDGRPVTWKVTVFADGNQYHERFELRETVANGGGYASVLTGEPTLERTNIVVWATYDGEVGPGGWIRQTLHQGNPQDFYMTPAESEPPDPPNAEGRASSYTAPTATGSEKTTSAAPQRTGLTYSGSSNTPYVGDDGAIYGHKPSHAFDDDAGTFWLSVGNARPDAPYAYEWVEGKTIGPVSITEVEVNTPYRNLYCYVSVFVNGGWVKHAPGDVIPYDPNHAASAPNGSNVPYVHAGLIPSSGPTRIKLRQSYPGTTRVRVTFHNLANSGKGTYPYRAAVKELRAFSDGAPTQQEQNNTTPVPTPPPTEIVDENGNVIKNAYIVGGAGDEPGKYEDYSDIVKLLCAWGGFFWHEHSQRVKCNGQAETVSFGVAPFNLGPNIDPVLGGFESGRGGRVWGDFEVAGTAGVTDLKADIFDKKPLIEGINHVKEILGFLFYIDEEGSAVFRSPNIFAVGNWVLNRSSNSGRTAEMVVIDELQTLVDLTATLSSNNVREHIFIASTNAKVGAAVKGWNPNPSGWRRVAGWTDQGFQTEEECALMADMIALRQLFTYRTDSITVPGYPRIQINDQVRINERVTGESYIHFVKSINSTLDMESGEWTYNLGTHWLGERPFSDWAFDPSQLRPSTQRYLEDVRGVDLTSAPPEPPKKVPPTYTFPEYGG